MSKIKVLIVDDSALIRRLLGKIIDDDPSLEVVGTAADPYIAREKIKKLKPDVITLDVEMPKMDGITFLKNLMRLHPMPVVMISSLTEKGADITLNALEIGAVDFVPKPKMDVENVLTEYAEDIRQKLKSAASAKVKKSVRKEPETISVDPKYTADAILEKKKCKKFGVTEKLLIVGASTGGTEAIKYLLSSLPASTPGMLITQHIPESFSAPFAARVNEASEMTVLHAEDGQRVEKGHAYIAPGDCHLMLVRKGGAYYTKLSDGPAVNRHKPSVDVLYRSAAQEAGPNATAVLLTGMGDDGARGMLEMLEVGCRTIAQDEKTSVVWGMPGAAVKLGAAQEILPLEKVADAILNPGRNTKRYGT